MFSFSLIFGTDVSPVRSNPRYYVLICNLRLYRRLTTFLVPSQRSSRSCWYSA
ncbi:hypothetical protein J132_06948 [Termitomyces sp. J132]|nr:hypothetical protein J132_06948 [Termitomyces sp. J132]